MAKKASAVKKGEQQPETETAEQTAVQAPGETALSQGSQPRGMEDVLPQQIEVPAVRIIQPSSTEKPEDNSRDGHWYCLTSMQGLGEKIGLVPIALFNSRVMWDRDNDDLTEPPLCSSVQARYPEGGESPPDENGTTYDNCLTCPFAIRQRDPENARRKLASRCDLVVNFFGLVFPGGTISDDEEPLFARVPFQRTGYAIGEKIINTSKFGRPRLDLWGRGFVLSTVKGDSSKGNYFVPTMQVAGLVSELAPARFAEAEAAFEDWATIKTRVMQEANAEMYEAAKESSGSSATPQDGSEKDDDLPF